MEDIGDLFGIFDEQADKSTPIIKTARQKLLKRKESPGDENSTQNVEQTKSTTGAEDLKPNESKKAKINADKAVETTKDDKISENKHTDEAASTSKKLEKQNEVLSADAKTKNETSEDTLMEEDDPVLECLPKEVFVKNIHVHKLQAPAACTHEVAMFENEAFPELKVNKNSEPAKKYPFVLDPFQQQAILCIENAQSVLVSAHTSAGKTVVAEYAIAKSLALKQRVIYTTPIKALSNQKYREFTEQFGDVGLITGDVTINPTASCLIMTTEILRNMLYRGSEIMREVGWVVFDEIHYMRDKERGVVWEETLILLPDNVRYVFLSATIPNARQFAEWVTHLHKQPCHVVYTDYRPTPLQHFLFPAGSDGIYLIVDEKGEFREENFNSAMATLQNGEAAKGDRRGRRGGTRGVNSEQSNIFKILKMVMERQFAPVIIFSFSKRECETYAMQLAKLDFNTAEEKKLVTEVFNNAIELLNIEDRELPQLSNILPLLRRGIGIHHGGLLPILKEVVEILFGEGLIKALFATETFAMGLNMPARTVLFTAPRKFDGKDFRWISSGEYIQMAGRAGRRGIDDKGIVILMIDEKVSPAVGRGIVQGQADPITSAFHLSYNMVLNLLRVEEINPEYMLERSFRQFQNQASIPALYAEYKEKQKALEKMVVPEEESIKTYYNVRKTLDNLNAEFQSWINNPIYLTPFLQPGRLVKVKNKKFEYGWGVVLQIREDDLPTKRNPVNPTNQKIFIDTLLHVEKDSADDEFPKPCTTRDRGNMEVVTISNDVILHVSSLRVHVPSELHSSDNRRSTLKTICEIEKRFPKGIPLLNAYTDMKINCSKFKDLIDKIELFEHRMKEHPFHESTKVNKLYSIYVRKLKLEEDLDIVRSKMKQAKSLLQMEELNQRKRVLRRLEYSNETDVIEFKGRVACELSAADELLLTELIFNGVFNNLHAAHIAALLSCFVCDDKTNEAPKLASELAGSLRILQDLARRIAKVSRECKLSLDEDAYLEKFKPTLMDVVLAWCQGATFASLCKLTDVFEGSIIRCMRRLEELLRQMCQAAKTIGNTELENKFAEAVRMLKRDIVFAASLYL